MNRRNTILCALLAAQLVLVLVIYWPREAADTSAGITLIDVAPEKVASIIISDGYGSDITISRERDAWVIDPPENYPADTERVRSALRKISHLQSSRLVSSSKGSQGRLRVSDEKFNRKIRLVDTDGKEHVIYLGTTQGKGVYARSGNSDDVVFIDNLSSWEFATSPRSWWKSIIVDIAPDAVNEIDIRNSHGQFRITRNRDDRWIDASGAVLDQDKVKRLLLAVKNMRLSEYVKKDADHKLKKTDASLKLVLAKGNPVTMEVGPEDKSERLVRASTDEHLMKVRSSELKQILDAKIDDLKPESKPENKSEEAKSQADSKAEGGAEPARPESLLKEQSEPSPVSKDVSDHAETGGVSQSE
jgi:hypothetical protein